MRKEELLKKIIENPEFRNNYWEKFEINPKTQNYSHVNILKSKNPFLISLYELIIEEKETPNVLYKKILNNFKL